MRAIPRDNCSAGRPVRRRTRRPTGMQWRLEPGSDLVVQLHLQPTGKPEPVRVSVGFFFTDTPPARTPDGIAARQRDHRDSRQGEREYVVTDRYVLPVDVDLLAIQPHAHNLARRMEAAAALPDGSIRPLISLTTGISVGRTCIDTRIRRAAEGHGALDALRLRQLRRNVRNPHHPPVRVVWGQNTTGRDGRSLAAGRRADSSATIASSPRCAPEGARRRSGCVHEVAAEHPGDPLRHDAVAALYSNAARSTTRSGTTTESVRLDPRSAQTHYNLGLALSVRGRRDAAIAEFEAALRIDPDYAQAHNNLGALLQTCGEALRAIEHYRRAIALRPDSLDARDNLGQLLSSQGRPVEAATEFHAALAIAPDDAKALSGLAWIKATAANPALRNPDEAVRLAEHADRETGHRDIAVLDALAAAYASAGRFPEAIIGGARGHCRRGDGRASLCRSAISEAAGALRTGPAYRAR